MGAAICVVALLGWLQSRGVPGWLALLLVIAIVLGLLIALIAFLGISIAQLAQALPTYQEQAQAGIANLQTALAQLGIDISGIVSLDFLQPERILGLLGGVVATVVNALSNAVFMLLIIIFLLIEAAGFPAKLRTKVRADDHPCDGYLAHPSQRERCSGLS